MELKIEELRAATGGEPNILCVEIGDRIAVLSGGAGRLVVLATTDGKKLYRRATPRGNGLRGARFIGKDLWIVGEYGLCARSSDRAASWDRVPTQTRECLWDIVRDDRGDLWVGGSGKAILRGKKGGDLKSVKHALAARDDRADPRIELVPAGVFFTLFNAVWTGAKFVRPKGLKGAMCALARSPATGTIVVVGDKGAAVRSVDGGLSFQPVKVGVTSHLNDVAFVAGGFVAVGAKGLIRRSEDDGVTWKPVKSNTKVELWSIGSWGDGAFIGGERGLVLKLSSPADTYWKGAVDEFAPRPVVAANVARLRVPTPEEREERHAKRLAAAAKEHEALAKKLRPFRVAPDGDHDAHVVAAIDSVDEYQVYGDALQARGDVQGELIALATADRAKETAAYLKKHARTLLGPIADHVETRKRLQPYDEPKAIQLEWRWGFIRRARIQSPDAETWFEDEAKETDVVRLLAQLLELPSARFLQELVVGIVSFEDNGYERVIAELAKTRLPALRSLFLGDFSREETEISWSSIGDLGKLYPSLGNLEALTLRSGSMKLGTMLLPRLRRLDIITGGFDKKNLKSIVSADVPSLEHLGLYFGEERYGCDIARKDLTALLHSDRFPRLTSLGLCNAAFADELCAWLHTSPLVAQCTHLDLSRGTLGDAGAHALATYARALAHLERLDVSHSYLSNLGIKQLRAAFPGTQVVAEHQRLRAGDEFGDRYVMVSE